jgi:hypothetical protein
MIVYSLAYSSDLKMKALLFSETSVNSDRRTWRNILEDSVLQEVKYVFGMGSR